jgi:putative phosphoribosyl transferase
VMCITVLQMVPAVKRSQGIGRTVSPTLKVRGLPRVRVMIFTTREEAGRQLARRLEVYANRKNTIVLGIPRGGVTVAFEVAQALHLPLDIFLSRKLGVPGQEELAFGAIAAGDGRFLDQQVIRAAGISPQEIEHVTQEVKETLQQRASLYRGNRPPLQIEGRTIILVDDGIATGSSIYAAINALQHMRIEKLVVAVPVAPAFTCAWLRAQVDQLVCLYAPEQFYAVGQFYRSFSQVSDKEVIDLLRRAERFSLHTVSASESNQEAGEREVSIVLQNARLEGTLSLPKDAKGIVLFAHGSGSSRHSPRNRYVAEVILPPRNVSLS